MSATVCVDTSALLALANPRDQYHAAAVAAARKHLDAGGRFIGSVLVLGELHGHLLQRRGAAQARAVLTPCSTTRPTPGKRYRPGSSQMRSPTGSSASATSASRSPTP